MVCVRTASSLRFREAESLTQTVGQIPCESRNVLDSSALGPVETLAFSQAFCLHR